MIEYRCYLIDDGGHISDVSPFVAASDEEAMSIAEDRCREHPKYRRYALWNGGRQVIPDTDCIN
jgi:hypothetical protein